MSVFKKNMGVIIQLFWGYREPSRTLDSKWVLGKWRWEMRLVLCPGPLGSHFCMTSSFILLSLPAAHICWSLGGIHALGLGSLKRELQVSMCPEGSLKPDWRPSDTRPKPPLWASAWVSTLTEVSLLPSCPSLPFLFFCFFFFFFWDHLFNESLIYELCVWRPQSKNHNAFEKSLSQQTEKPYWTPFLHKQ